MNAADLIHWTQYWTIEILVFLFAAELKVCNFTSTFKQPVPGKTVAFLFRVMKTE